MPRRVKVPISTARGELFKLASWCASRDGTIVVLEGRGGVEPVALVREARLAYLEDRVAQMDLRAPASFTLGGSLATAVDDETLSGTLRELRAAWTGPSPDAATQTKKASSASKPTTVRKRARRA